MPDGNSHTATTPVASPYARTTAVAIKRENVDAPPVIVASGRGHLADEILSIAFEHDVKVREDADLVEVLAAFDVDSEVPAEALAAVAEILAYVYRANQAETSTGQNR